MNKLFVIAPLYQWYVDWCNRHTVPYKDPRLKCIIPGTPDQRLLGMRGGKFVVVYSDFHPQYLTTGGWWAHNPCAASALLIVRRNLWMCEFEELQTHADIAAYLTELGLWPGPIADTETREDAYKEA